MSVSIAGIGPILLVRVYREVQAGVHRRRASEIEEVWE